MDKEIWVYAELADGKPAPVFYELIAKADEIASTKGWNTAAVILGSNLDHVVETLQDVVDKIYVADHPRLAEYTLDLYAAALEELVKAHHPEMILVGATGIGAELAPTLAAKVKTGLAAHCVDIQTDSANGRINCLVPAFGGKVISEIYIPEARPMMASVRPGILNKRDVHRTCRETIREDMQFLDNLAVRETFLEMIPEEPSGISVEAANVVVAAGRGAAVESTWKDIQSIAEKMGGAVGWTRNFVDSGLVESEANMIGTSGKSVRPSVFIGFGISGATHFICGMSKSKLILNVNSDPNAKIFQYSDYGIVGDAGQFAEALLEKLCGKHTK